MGDALEAGGLPGPTDAWTTLAGLARDTTTIRLGTLVTSATFRLPGPLAISVAGVDQMSGGRVELGLGAGWYEREHDAYGIPFPSLARRASTGSRSSWPSSPACGRRPSASRSRSTASDYRLVDSPALPKPVQAGGIPVIVGGGGRSAGPGAGRSVRGGVQRRRSPPSSASSAQRQRVIEACEAIGRDPATVTWSTANTVCLGADEAELRTTGGGHRSGRRRAARQRPSPARRTRCGRARTVGGSRSRSHLPPGPRPRRPRSPRAHRRLLWIGLNLRWNSVIICPSWQ